MKSTKRYILCQRRSEEGKAIRKLAKSDKGLPFSLCKCYVLRMDGIANTITTTPIDNWIFSYNGI